MIDTKTDNRSFVDCWHQFQDMGINNASFMLQLKNSNLKTLPTIHSSELSKEAKALILDECKQNVWYFFREVVVLPNPYNRGKTERYTLTPYTAVMIYLYDMNINYIQEIRKDMDEYDKTMIEITIMLLEFYHAKFRDSMKHDVVYLANQKENSVYTGGFASGLKSDLLEKYRSIGNANKFISPDVGIALDDISGGFDLSRIINPYVNEVPPKGDVQIGESRHMFLHLYDKYEEDNTFLKLLFKYFTKGGVSTPNTLSAVKYSHGGELIPSQSIIDNDDINVRDISTRENLEYLFLPSADSGISDCIYMNILLTSYMITPLESWRIPDLFDESNGMINNDYIRVLRDKILYIR